MGIFSYRMTLRYDGTAYSGWQLQPEAPTIQSVVEGALTRALREPREKLKVGGAGRTDKGVHAEGQVVHFYSDHERLMERADDVAYRINRLLPPDVRVSELKRTAPDFNATISSLSKTYHYHVDTGPEQHPCSFRYRLHHPRPLDLGAMRAAAAPLVGTHDFSRFSNYVRRPAERRRPIKTLRRVDVVVAEPSASAAAAAAAAGGVLRLEFEGSGFLYKMVRHLTGALLAVGRGELPPDFLQQQLLATSSSGSSSSSSSLEPTRGLYRGYKVAPAKGLTLFHVAYPPEADDPTQLLYPHLPHDQYGRLLDVSLESIGSDPE